MEQRMARPYDFKKMADGNVKLVTSEIEVVQRIYQRYVNGSIQRKTTRYSSQNVLSGLLSLR